TDEEMTHEMARIIEPRALGRGANNNTPDVVRKFVAEEAINGVPAKELTEAIKVSHSSISAYKNCATSCATYNEPDKKLKNHVVNVKDRITRKATNRLNSALNALTPEKLEEVKARDLAGIAKDMSAIVRNMNPESEKGEEKNVQFIFFAPRMTEENDYDI